MKIALGNPGKRPIDRDQPTVPGVPTPPDHLSNEARRMWFNLCPILESMGVLAKQDAIALERLCECYSEVVSLQKAIAKGGRFQKVKTKNGGTFERQRPHVAALADADRRLKSYLIEFGLSPASLGKVNAKKPETPDAGDAYFG